MDHGASLANLFSEPPPPPVETTEQRLRIGTANLWIRRSGSRASADTDTYTDVDTDTDTDTAPVIFVHPWTGSAHCWPYQEIGFVNAGHPTICYSRRGYRGSDCGEAEDTADAVDDLAELVATLNLDRFHLVGSAAGAMTCAGFAVRHRNDQRLASITLACSMIGIPNSAIDGLGSVTSFPQWKELPHHIRELGPSYRSVNAQGVALWRELHDTCRGDNPGDYHQRLGGVSSLAELAEIDVPTLYLSGSADLYSPPPLLELFAQQTPGAEFAVVEGVGHSAYWERPQTFNEIVLAFIERSLN